MKRKIDWNREKTGDFTTEAMEQEYYDELEDWGNDNFHDKEAEHNLSTWA